MSNKQRIERETAARRLEAERLAVKAREKEVLDKQQNALRRQKEFREKTQVWNEQVLPRWHDLFQGESGAGGFGWAGLLGSGRSAKVRDLCHKGIPPNIRGKVWPLMIRNDLKINGEIFEHLNRKVIQIYGVNLTANKPAHPDDQKHPAVSPVYRDSFLGLFDEGHPLYPRDGSPANKDAMKFARDTSSVGGGRESQGKSVTRAGQFRLNHNLLNNPSKLEPEQRGRTLSVMKRAQSLSSLATLVTSEKGTVFSVRLSPVRSERPDADPGDPEGASKTAAATAATSEDLSTAHMPCADITEEAWFENERNGSMDQSAFEYVQKQLFLGSEMAEERAKSTEYIGSGQKPPFFGALEIIEEEDVALECSIDPIPPPAVESCHPSGGNVSESQRENERADTPTKERRDTNLSRNSDFEYSPVRPRSSSAAADSPSQSQRSSRRLGPGAAVSNTVSTASETAAPVENQSKPPTASMLKAALTNSEHKEHHKGAKHSKGADASESFKKVNGSFFSSDSEEESEADSEEDDVIPHIIPMDIPQRSRSGSLDEATYDPAATEAAQLHLNTHQNAHISTQNLSEEDARLDMSFNINISPIKIDRPNSSRSFTPSRLSPMHAHSNSHSPHHSHSPDNGHNLALEGAALSDLDSSVYSDSAFHSAYQSSTASPHGTPPPRSKHTEDYLVGAGLINATASGEGGEDNWGRPPKVGVSSGSNSHRLRLMFPHPHSPHNSAHNSAHVAAAHSPTQSRAGSYNSRSYSRQSIEDILQHALGDRDTEGSAFAPTNSRFSFQSGSLSARLGSMDGSAVLLSDEPILVQDHNYFPTPPHLPEEVPSSASSSSGGAGDAPGPVGTSGAVGSGSGNSAGIAASGALSPPGGTARSGETGTNNLSAAATEQLINSMSLIEWDLPRTYPTLGFFHDGGPMHTGLERVLMCYVCYRPDVGYVQGMSYIVATLLLYMDEFEAFKCMANLLGRKMNMDFYCLQKEAIDSYVQCFNFFFEKMLPLLFEHFRNEGVTSEMFLLDWMLSIFTKTLPLEVAAHIWDVYLFEGEMYLMCVALGILKLYAPRLSMMSMERVSPFLLHLPEDIKPEELFNCIAQIKLSRKRYDRIRLKMAIKCYGSVEAYQKSFATPNPAFNPEDAYSPHSPLSSNGSTGLLTPPNAHIITTTTSASAAQRSAAPSNDFWGRRRGFRRSIIDTLTGKWGSQNSAITNGNTGGVQRANTTYSGGISPAAATNRRASTGTTTTSPLKK